MFTNRTAVVVGVILGTMPGAARLTAAPPASALAYRPDGMRLAAAAGPNVYLIDPKTGDDIGRLPQTPGRVTALAFSAEGRLAIAAGSPGVSGNVRVYDLASGKSPAESVAEFAAHKDVIHGLAFSPDGRQLATAGYDRLVKLWEVGKVTPRLTLTDHSDAVYALAFSPDGTLLATAAADRAVKVWDVPTGRRLYTLGDPTDWVYAIAWHPNGRVLAAGGVDKSIRLWEVTAEGGRLVKSAFAHDRAVTRLAFGPGGSTIISAGEDRAVKVWDAAKLTESRLLPAQPDEVLGFALRPDGKQLAVGRFDGTARFYDPSTGVEGVTFLPVKPKPPAVTRVSPESTARRTKSRLTLTGSRLDEATGVNVSDTAVSARLLPGNSASSRDIELAVGPTATIGPVSLTLTSPAGPSTAFRVIIDRFPVADSHAVKLPATVVGTVGRAGEADAVTFETSAGEQIGIEVVAEALGSKLDPVLTVTDAAGRTVTEGGTVLGFVAQASGRYAVNVRDREYRGGPDMTYRLHVGPIPVVTTVFPLGISRGKEASVHIDGVNLGSARGKTVTVHVPTDATPGSRVPVTIPMTGESPLGAVAVFAGEFPAVIASDGGADLRSVPGTADGILLRAGEAQTIRFTAKKGQRLVVETDAARLGSPVDPFIEVLDAAGKPIPRATLRCAAKTFLTFRDHDDRKTGLRLETWNELAANDYLYVGTELMRIKNLPGHPDADCDFVQVLGRRRAYLDTTPTHHAFNSPMYKVEIHPPGATFPSNGMPVFQLYYRNDDGGPGYGKDSRLFFDPPADGTYQVRVADSRGAGGQSFAYRLTVRPPRPDFSIAASPSPPITWRNGAVPVTLTATRLDGYEGPIRVRFEGLPPGFSAPPTVIEAEQVVGVVPFTAAAEAPSAPAASPRVVATADIDGKEVVRVVSLPAPRAADGADLSIAVDRHRVSIRPGEEAKFVVTVERRNGFAGRVPLEVRGLPHGVMVQHLGLNGIMVTEKETRREVVVRAEPWVKPIELPFAVVGRVERKGTEHAAGAILSVK